jgi:hypothetical protein
VNPPHGLAELQAQFGALTLTRDPRGSGYVISSPAGWESDNMVIVPSLPGYAHKLYVNKAMVDPLTRALGVATDVCPEYVIRTMGCFCPRMKRVNGALSVHSWGLAVDICADTNPMGKPLRTDMPRAFIDAFIAQGFTWGGSFPTPDPMHMQWISGY